MTTTPTPVADRVVTVQEQAATHLPGEVLAAFAADLEDLRADGLPAGIAPVGSPVPDGELLDVDGRPTTLTEARDGHPAVVVFYRGAWCPYCNVALRVYQAELVGALEERGWSLLALSPQKPDGSLSTRDAAELTFTVLSDPGNGVAAGLGILFHPGERSLQGQKQLGLDTTEVNADGTTTLPMPTVALVDAGGILRWIDVHPDYTTRTEPGAVLAAIDALG